MGDVAHIVHRVRGRVRLRVPARKGDADYFRELADQLECAPGVHAVRSSPSTAGILVFHEGRFEAVASYAAERDLLVLQGRAAPRPPLTALAEALERVNARLRDDTAGRWGIGPLAFYGLVGAGIFQLARGNYFPAASSLFYHASSVLHDVTLEERRARQGSNTSDTSERGST